MELKNVGFIGLGLMGSRMAKRLAQKGFHVFAWNRTRSKAEGLHENITVCDSPEEVFKKVKVSIFMVKDGDAVLEVIFGKGGISGVKKGDLVIDMSTTGPTFSKQMYEDFLSYGVRYVDAPVLGSITPALNGELLIFVGGKKEDYEEVMPIFHALGKKVFFLNEIGKGSALKMVANMMLARMVSLLGDALAFGKKMGLEFEEILNLFDNSVLSSPMWKRGYRLIKEDPELHFPLKHILKDLNLMLKEGENVKFSMPELAIAKEEFLQTLIKVGEDKDYSMIAREKIVSSMKK